MLSLPILPFLKPSPTNFFQMKKPASPVKTAKTPKPTPEEKSVRKSTKKAGRATAELNDDHASKKASQKKTLKSAAKQLQKELNNRMNEVVTRIRKETKAKLKEVVKEATRRLDGDTERMFEQALHTIVRHYDSVAGTTATDSGRETSASKIPADNGTRGRTEGPTLNKDGTPRKSRITSGKPDRKSKSGSATATKPTKGAKRGPKPRNQAALATDTTTTEASAATEAPATPTAPRSTAKKSAAKPATKSAPKRATKRAAVSKLDATSSLNPADSPSTGEVSE